MPVYVWRSLRFDVLEGMHLMGCETPVIVAVLPAVGQALFSLIWSILLLHFWLCSFVPPLLLSALSLVSSTGLIQLLFISELLSL